MLMKRSLATSTQKSGVLTTAHTWTLLLKLKALTLQKLQKLLLNKTLNQKYLAFQVL